MKDLSLHREVSTWFLRTQQRFSGDSVMACELTSAPGVENCLRQLRKVHPVRNAKTLKILLQNELAERLAVLFGSREEP